MQPFKQNNDYALRNSLLGAVALTKNVDFDKYEHCGYGTGFDARRTFLLSDGSGLSKNVIIFGAEMSSSVHVDNRNQNILVLGKGSA